MPKQPSYNEEDITLVMNSFGYSREKAHDYYARRDAREKSDASLRCEEIHELITSEKDLSELMAFWLSNYTDQMGHFICPMKESISNYKKKHKE